MKKATAILLLAIILFNSTGYFVYFKIAQIEIKKEIKKEIKLHLQSEELTVIRFSNSDINTIHWIEKNKEFIYKDQMFDIVRRSSDSNETTFYCINDKQEKKLFQNLEEQVLKQIENNKNSKSDSSKKNVDNIIKTYFFEENTLTVFQRASSCFYSIIEKTYTSVDVLISSPPPRC
jgi:site-specific DNA-adenine methylase